MMSNGKSPWKDTDRSLQFLSGLSWKFTKKDSSKNVKNGLFPMCLALWHHWLSTVYVLNFSCYKRRPRMIFSMMKTNMTLVLGYTKLDIPCGTDNHRTKHFFCKFAELGHVKKWQNWTFKVNSLFQKSLESF